MSIEHTPSADEDHEIELKCLDSDTVSEIVPL